MSEGIKRWPVRGSPPGTPLRLGERWPLGGRVQIWIAPLIRFEQATSCSELSHATRCWNPHSAPIHPRTRANAIGGMGRPAKTTEAQRQAIRKALGAGATVTSMAAKFKVSRATIIGIRSAG